MSRQYYYTPPGSLESSGPAGGYSLEIYNGQLDKKYLCGHCHLILREPLQSFCGHRFCKTCTAELLRNNEEVTCPACTEEGADGEFSIIKRGQIFPDNAMKREFLSWKVKCENIGCDWTGPFTQYEAHHSNCEFKMTVCACGRSVPASQLQQHLENECPARTTSCEYCQAEVPVLEKENHSRICPKTPVQCDECGKEMLREQLTNHYNGECNVRKIACPYGCGAFVAPERLSAHEGDSVVEHVRSINQRTLRSAGDSACGGLALNSNLPVQVSLGIPVTEPPTNVQETGGYFPPPPPPGDEPNLDDGGSPFIDVKVRPVDPNHFRHLVSNKDVYKIQRKKRSRALIINNENFMKNADVKLKDREGSNFDVVNLDSLLNQLGYTTEVKTDLTATEIVSVLHEERNHPDHADADSFVLAIFSHGATGAIYGRDGKPVQIEDIKESFDGLHCKSLAGKPKLLIIQACQGSQSTKGVPVADADSSEEDESSDPDRDTQDAVPWATVEQSMAHEKGDMLVAYSTVEGYKSWRLQHKGSWFIRTLVKIFMHYANQEHVVDLLTRVRDAIARKQTSLKKDGSGLFVQMTRNDDTLRKKWYFFPGYPPTPTF